MKRLFALLCKWGIHGSVDVVQDNIVCLRCNKHLISVADVMN